MSYVLGAAAASTPAAKTAAGVAYVLTPTAEQDGFESLFNAYKAAYPAGTSLVTFAGELCRVNGIRYSTVDIERWVFGKSGKRFAFVKNNSPEAALTRLGRTVPDDLKGKGWAHFGEGNTILLPDIPRADGKGKKPDAPPADEGRAETASTSSTGIWWIIGGGVLLALALGARSRQKTTIAPT